MFTTNDLDRALAKMKTFRKKSPFSRDKNLSAYRLSKMTSQYRGMAVEHMVADFFRSKGSRVFHFGANCSFDMLVNGKKIEVKSSLAVPKIVNGQMKYEYNFKHICPANFHKLVMVFISPEGLDVRVMDSRTVAKYLGCKNYHKDFGVRKKIVGKVLAA